MEVVWKAIGALLVLLGYFVGLKRSAIGNTLRVAGYISYLNLLTFTDYYVDALILVCIIIGSINTVYVYLYSVLKYKTTSMPVLVDLFNISMILTFASNSLLELITFWLLTELLGFFLIAYDYLVFGDRLAMSAAIKYLLFSMIPTDVSLFILLALTGFVEAIEYPLKSINPVLDNPLVSLLIVIGFFSKAAIFPLHFWLPDAHSIAPSPASVLLSGIMVKMGVYAIYLLTYYNINRSVVVLAILAFGSITVIYGALQAMVQVDIKRILAYSTTSNTGFILMLLALYMITADLVFLEASIVYTLAHALYKAALFMDSGFIEVSTHRRNVYELGYIHRVFPWGTLPAVLAILSILGLPPSIGFLAKIFAFTAISKYIGVSWIYILSLILATTKVFLSVIYNANYLRAHIGTNTIGYFDRDAKVLSLAVLVLSATAYLISYMLVALDYKGFIEFILLKKMMPVIALSSLVIISVSYIILKLLTERSPSTV